MHGNKESPEMPIFGNKVLGVMRGTLEMHGVPRKPTWSMIESTAEVGDEVITMNEEVDWEVGETIVIAPTSYDCFEAEVVNITSIDRSNPSKPKLYLSKKLEYKHYAGIEHYGSDTLEMRAEVGLLTRNVVFRGDEETSYQN